MTRIDRSGVRETVGFVDSGTELMAMTTTAPRDPTAGLLLCPSLFTEALRNYRREALLARAAAATGLAVARMQYRGTGNSDDVEITRDTIVEDARNGMKLLGQEADVSQLAFGGTRFGGLVAATVAAEVPGAPLVLVEPVDDARRFLDEGLRAKTIALFRSKSGRATVAELVARLEDEGRLDLMGHELGAPLYRSTEGWRLAEALGPDPRPILLIQLGEDEPLRPEYERLLATWREAGFDVESASVGSRRTWWFLHEQIEEGQKIRKKGLSESDEVLATITGWLQRTMAMEPAR